MHRIAFYLIYFTIYVNCATISIIQIHQNDLEHFNQSTNSQTVNSLNELTNSNQQNNICTNEICEMESIKMISYMNQNVNACDDFYQFACGQYLQNTKLPADRDLEISVTQVQDKVDEQLQSILTDELCPNETKPFQLAKLLTKACMDEAMLNKMGMLPNV